MPDEKDLTPQEEADLRFLEERMRMDASRRPRGRSTARQLMDRMIDETNRMMLLWRREGVPWDGIIARLRAAQEDASRFKQAEQNRQKRAKITR